MPTRSTFISASSGPTSGIGTARTGHSPPIVEIERSLADRWILSKAQRLVEQATALFRDYDFAAAKSETEGFFWQVLADNYLEMCKLPLYEENSPGARYALHTALLTVLKLFAPFLPYVTAEIYQGLFSAGSGSIHRANWPAVDESLLDEQAEAAGDVVVEIATAVRRYKTENQLRMGAELARLQVVVQDIVLRRALRDAAADIRSVTRAQQVEIVEQVDTDLKIIQDTGMIAVALEE